MKNSIDKEDNSDNGDTIRSRRKKNPKDMSIEELEDYIQKNRNRNISYASRYALTESKSLNSSFQSHNHLSFFDNNNNTNNNQNLNKTQTINKQPSSDSSNSSIAKPNSNYINSTSNQNFNANNNSNTNPITSLNSKAASNYLKSLQEKIKALTNENEELKQKVNNNNNDEGMQMKIDILNQNILLLEKEKNRHIEQNAIEKEENMKIIEQLKSDLENITQKYNEKVEEVEKIKAQFENERSEMIETMKSLREIIFQKENEKNSIIMQFENIVQEQNDKISILQQSSSSVSNKKTTMNTSKGFRAKSKDKLVISKTTPKSNTLSSSKKQLKTSTGSSVKNTKTKPKTKHITKTSSNPKPKAKLQEIPYQNEDMIQNNVSNQNNIANNNFILTELNSIRSDYDFTSGENTAHIINQPQEHDINTVRSSPDYEEQLNQINQNIFDIERALPELTRDYKNIVSRLSVRIFILYYIDKSISRRK